MREGISTLSLKESLKKRSEFSLSCGFRDVWEDTYGIPLNSFRKITTWHFMCELLPLPKKSEYDFPYTGRWRNLQEYLSEVVDKRFSIITNLIEKSIGTKLIIVYDKKTQRLLIDKWGSKLEKVLDYEFSKDGKRPQRYTLYSGNIAGQERKFLYTPFLVMD